MSHKKPLKATDRRRQRRNPAVNAPDAGESGVGNPLANLFHDRRYPNGKGKRAV